MIDRLGIPLIVKVHQANLAEGKQAFELLAEMLFCSKITLREGLRNVVSWGALEDPLTMVTLTPTENLKVDTTKGPVEIGKDADLVVLAPDLMVHAVLISGQSVLL